MLTPGDERHLNPSGGHGASQGGRPFQMANAQKMLDVEKDRGHVSQGSKPTLRRSITGWPPASSRK